MKVLIVDDEPLIRRSLERLFKKAGHEVVTAEDGTQGVEKWNSSGPDVVVLDILMPGHTGPEVIEHVQPPVSTGIILISAYSGEYNLDSAKKLGADLFIAKPFEDIQKIVSSAEELYKSKAQ